MQGSCPWAWRSSRHCATTLLFRCRRNLKRKKEIIIKLISKKDFNELISNGIIGECSVDGNNSATGKHSSGYYDVKKYNKAKRETPDASEKYLKTIDAHVGVEITRHKIYIEDEYVK